MSRVRNARQLEALPEPSKAARKSALSAIARARRDDITIAEAIRRERVAGRHVSMESIWRYAPEAVTRDPQHRLVPTPHDRIYRRIPFLTPDGVAEVDVRSSRRASLVGEFRNALKAFLDGDDPTGAGLRRFRGKRVGGRLLETDLDAIEASARRRELDELNQEGS